MEVELTCEQCKKTFRVTNLDAEKARAVIGSLTLLCGDCMSKLEWDE